MGAWKRPGASNFALQRDFYIRKRRDDEYEGKGTWNVAGNGFLSQKVAKKTKKGTWSREMGTR